MSPKRGDKVTIYEHPLDETVPEGEALLLKRLSECGTHNGRKVTQWHVAFTTEDGGRYRCVRTLLEPSERTGDH